MTSSAAGERRRVRRSPATIPAVAIGAVVLLVAVFGVGAVIAARRSHVTLE